MVLPETFSAICVSQIRRMASVCVEVRPTEIMYNYVQIDLLGFSPGSG